MKYDGFRIVAYPQITDAKCRKCHNTLVEVDNGWISTAMFCPHCESIFVLKLVKLPDKKISKNFLNQCKEQNRKQNK